MFFPRVSGLLAMSRLKAPHQSLFAEEVEGGLFLAIVF